MSPKEDLSHYTCYYMGVCSPYHHPPLYFASFSNSLESGCMQRKVLWEITWIRKAWKRIKTAKERVEMCT